jgi:hypothetical protein
MKNVLKCCSKMLCVSQASFYLLGPFDSQHFGDSSHVNNNNTTPEAAAVVVAV